MNAAQDTKAPTIGVLALQGDFAEHIVMLEQVGVNTLEVRLPEQLPTLDGLIIPGGESTTIARLLAEWGLLQPIRDRAQHGMAVWGTCAGAILLARWPGDLDREGFQLMDIEVKRNAFGRQVDSFEVDLDVGVLGPLPFHAIFIRAPRITRAGPDVKVLANLSDGTIVAAQQENLLATSFHPELTGDARFHDYFVRIASGDRTQKQPVGAADG